MGCRGRAFQDYTGSVMFGRGTKSTGKNRCGCSGKEQACEYRGMKVRNGLVMCKQQLVNMSSLRKKLHFKIFKYFNIFKYVNILNIFLGEEL